LLTGTAVSGITSSPLGVASCGKNSKDEPADRDSRYRARLRDAEADNERLRGTIATLQHAEIVRLASARLADPADLFRDGVQRWPTCAARMAPSTRRVDSAVNGVLEAHPPWQAPQAPCKGPLFSGATSVRVEPSTKKFADAFSPGPKPE
jgi:hypothetical protein